jgi:hypothetical protein
VDSPTVPAPPAPRVLLERLRAAADARDWDGLRALCHPGAVLVLRIPDGRGLPLDEALDVLRAEAEAGEFEPIHYYVDDVDDQAVIALGSISRNGTVTHLCWLVTFVDGLVYRQALYRTLGEAHAAYAGLGGELGLTR